MTASQGADPATKQKQKKASLICETIHNDRTYLF